MSQKQYEEESALVHQLMTAAHGDAEEHLAGVLDVLVNVARMARLESVAEVAEQSLIELTGIEA